jgi:hypothetical protein
VVLKSVDHRSALAAGFCGSWYRNIPKPPRMSVSPVPFTSQAKPTRGEKKIDFVSIPLNGMLESILL